VSTLKKTGQILTGISKKDHFIGVIPDIAGFSKFMERTCDGRSPDPKILCNFTGFYSGFAGMDEL